MIKWIGRIYDVILYGALALSGVLIAVGIALVVIDVSARALGFQPFSFTVAFVEYILLYFVLLAAPYLVREKGHVCADMIRPHISGLPRMLMEKFVYILCITVSLIFCWVGLQLLIEAVQYGYVDERSIDIPYWCLYLFYPPCFLLIAIEFARYLLGAGSFYDRSENLESM